ncbi:hypothetical protein AGMMS49574_04470 [Bacteroidia bacterium]|nr:hypothetical protein AGMMS49574_04470 [Bacteroidia bacterium]GHU55942.1 hypothetical protein FACS189411_05400 [Bacteroidia bacterium]GHV06414.1 hypothetical protein FACS189416_6990 [Bacteroidia bacterium]
MCINSYNKKDMETKQKLVLFILLASLIWIGGCIPFIIPSIEEPPIEEPTLKELVTDIQGTLYFDFLGVERWYISYGYVGSYDSKDYYFFAEDDLFKDLSKDLSYKVIISGERYPAGMNDFFTAGTETYFIDIISLKFIEI